MSAAQLTVGACCRSAGGVLTSAAGGDAGLDLGASAVLGIDDHWQR